MFVSVICLCSFVWVWIHRYSDMYAFASVSVFKFICLWTHMYFDMYVFVFICANVNTHILWHVCIHVHMCECRHTCTLTCVCFYICVHVHLYGCRHICTLTCMCLFLYMCWCSSVWVWTHMYYAHVWRTEDTLGVGPHLPPCLKQGLSCHWPLYMLACELLEISNSLPLTSLRRWGHASVPLCSAFMWVLGTHTQIVRFLW